MRVTYKQIAFGVLLMTTVGAVAKQFTAHTRQDSCGESTVALFQVPPVDPNVNGGHPQLPVPDGSFAAVVNIGHPARHMYMIPTDDSAGAAVMCGASQQDLDADTTFVAGSTFFGSTYTVADTKGKKATKVIDVYLRYKHSHEGHHYDSIMYMDGENQASGNFGSCFGVLSNGKTVTMIKACLDQIVKQGGGDRDCDDKHDGNCNQDDD